jgi:hypothetical protein
MASNSKKRKSAQRLSRSDLLPMSPAIARSISLKNHMALAALRNGQGNIDLAGELLKTLYWTFYLSDAVTVHEQKDNLIAAEKALKSSIVSAADTKVWVLIDTDALSISALLRLHDDQLSSLPVHRLEKAKHRLQKLFAQEAGFPAFVF